MGRGRAPVPRHRLPQNFNSAFWNSFVSSLFCIYKSVRVWKCNCSSAASNTTHVPLHSPTTARCFWGLWFTPSASCRSPGRGRHGWAAPQAARGQHTRTLQQDRSFLQVKDHRQQCDLQSRDLLWQILVIREQERAPWTSVVCCCFVRGRAEKHNFYT